MDHETLMVAFYDALDVYGEPIEGKDAAELAAKLLRYSPVQRWMALRNRDASSRLNVLHSLLTLVKAERTAPPARALALAGLGVEVAMGMRVRLPQGPVLADFRAQALAEWANALRRSERYRAAASVWKRVHHQLELGTGDPALQAELQRLEATLCLSQQRLPEAIRLLRESLPTLADLGRPDLASLAQVMLGIALLRLGRYDEAAVTTRAALSKAVEGGDSQLCLRAFHNLVLIKAEAGELEGAAALLVRLAPLYKAAEDPLLNLRAEWVAGRLGAHWQEWRGAAERFEVVRQGFVDLGLAYDASLVSLELAIAYLHQGRAAKVKALAQEMYPVFIAQEIPREASAALLLFVEAAERKAATIKSVSSLLEKLKNRLAPKSRRGSQGRFVT